MGNNSSREVNGQLASATISKYQGFFIPLQELLIFLIAERLVLLARLTTVVVLSSPIAISLSPCTSPATAAGDPSCTWKKGTMEGEGPKDGEWR